MYKQVSAWLGERIPVDWSKVRLHLQEKIPSYLRNFSYALGGTPLILFGILVLTGIMLTFNYVPSPMHAHASVNYITTVSNYGWLIRGIHATAANLMIFTVLLHMIRVFVTRAYQKPREFTWMTGVCLLFTTLAAAFTGYSLVSDQLSYWATTVGTSLIASIPVVGETLLWMLRGGPDVNPNTLLRFYVFHVIFLPFLLTGFVILHVILIRLHGVKKAESGDASTYDLFPDHVMKELILALLVLVVIINWVIAFPPVLGPVANPQITPEHIKPEWYFYPTFRWLKIVSFRFGVLSTIAVVLGMLFWPFIEPLFDKLGERFFKKLKLGFVLGILTFIFILVLLLVETFAAD